MGGRDRQPHPFCTARAHTHTYARAGAHTHVHAHARARRRTHADFLPCSLQLPPRASLFDGQVVWGCQIFEKKSRRFLQNPQKLS